MMGVVISDRLGLMHGPYDIEHSQVVQGWKYAAPCTNEVKNRDRQLEALRVERKTQ